MIVLYPWTVEHPEAIQALDDPLKAFVGDTDFAYWYLLADHWKRGEGFAVVEHDVIAPPGAIDTLAACDQPWCTHPIPRHRFPDQMLTASLGLARFSTNLLQTEPDVMAAAGRFAQGMPPKHWAHLDVAVSSVLIGRGYEPHIHQPPAVHLSA